MLNQQTRSSALHFKTVASKVFLKESHENPV